jgi:hypothetical protein
MDVGVSVIKRLIRNARWAQSGQQLLDLNVPVLCRIHAHLQRSDKMSPDGDRRDRWAEVRAA